MLHAQFVRELAAERNDRDRRDAHNRQLLAASRPGKQPQEHRWRSRRAWSHPEAVDHAPVQA